MKTLLDFATDRRLTVLLVKERAKCRRRNRNEKHHTLDKDCPIDELSTRKQLSRMMPPRRTWIRPSRRVKLPNGTSDTCRNAEKALLKTVDHDRRVHKETGKEFGYLKEMDAFFARIRARLTAETLSFQSPRLMPIYKDDQPMEDGSREVTCRPLATFPDLEDKIILALTSRYLTCCFDRYLHENLLSYRTVRKFHGKERYSTDFSDGVELIKAFRQAHNEEPIYVFDCDIKKFYDIIPHQVIRDCFGRVLDQSPLSADGRAMVMKVLNAYLNSYNFYTNALQEAEQHPEVYWKVQRKMHDRKKRNTYKLGWVDEVRQAPEAERRRVGVPQGGALSLLVANFVLNDVDQPLLAEAGDNMLFIRYCDDMILLHTDYAQCCRLMQLYEQSLAAHGLYYHLPKQVAECSSRSEFWKIKSHLPFLWADGEGNCNRYIGFLGYEMRRDGRMRLRKSNIERFKEKIRRIGFALRRYKRKLKRKHEFSVEDYLAFRTKTVTNLLDGVKFYKAFDQKRFEKGSQYRYLEKLGEKV